MLKEIAKKGYDPDLEKITNYIAHKLQNNNTHFNRMVVNYNFCKLAGLVGAKVKTIEGNDVPINMFAISLMPSGMGKTSSVNLVEKLIFSKSLKIFKKDLLPALKERGIEKLYAQYVNLPDNQDLHDDAVRAKAIATLTGLGMPYSKFSEGTSPGLKQSVTVLKLLGAGSLNLEVDEIGVNFISNGELITDAMELYDSGLVSNKLIKHTKESLRDYEIDGKVAINLLLFGTPAKLLDGGMIEEEFLSRLSMGMGRRSCFGYIEKLEDIYHDDAEKVFDDIMKSNENNADLNSLSDRIANLIKITNIGKELSLSREVHIELIKYKINCSKRALKYPDHKELNKIEMINRFFKTLKIAAAYAWKSGEDLVSLDNLHHAINFVEDSGVEFEKLMHRKPNYIRLFDYLASIKGPVTESDLVAALPFYNKNRQIKEELMLLATSHAQSNDGLLKKFSKGGVSYFEVVLLEKTKNNRVSLCYSEDIAKNYIYEVNAKFTSLINLISKDGYNFSTHKFVEGHRNKENYIKGFNMICLDVDKGMSLAVTLELLKEYSYIIYTTKRHTKEENRFRIMLPMSHKIYLDFDEHSKFMTNIYSWLPFEVDEVTKDLTRSWACNKDAEVFVNYSKDTKSLDAISFLDGTKKTEEVSGVIRNTKNINKLMVWFENEIKTQGGNRNSLMFRLIQVLIRDYTYSNNVVDTTKIKSMMLDFNSNLNNPLSILEMENTIFKQLKD